MSHYRCRMPRGEEYHMETGDILLTSPAEDQLPEFPIGTPGLHYVAFAAGGRREGKLTGPKGEEGYIFTESGLIPYSAFEKSGEKQYAESSEQMRCIYPMPDRSTGEESHRRGVEAITARLKRNPGEKTVLARVIVEPVEMGSGEIYSRLCREYPDAFVFEVSSASTGTWVGASPELLCRIRGNRVETMALAGTRPSGTGGEWDSKNREEQKIVERYIRRCLERYCDNVECSMTYTRKAGPVEHLCTDISAELKESDKSREEMLTLLLGDLSPTPALCGYPRERALREISEYEEWPRAYYGGHIALVREDGDADIYVNLRSMRLSDGKAALYAGGGIMAESDAESEWEETGRKAATLLRILKQRD